MVPQQHPEPWAPPSGAAHGAGIAGQGSHTRQAVVPDMAAGITEQAGAAAQTQGLRAAPWEGTAGAEPPAATPGVQECRQGLPLAWAPKLWGHWGPASSPSRRGWQSSRLGSKLSGRN